MLSQHDAATIRYPSVANLMVDSADRNTAIYPNANNFSINRPYSMLNGSFTRVGTTEIVFEWNYPNITSTNGAPGFSLSWTPTGGTSTSIAIALVSGFYTISELLNAMKTAMNLVTGTTGLTWSLAANTTGGAILSYTPTTSAVTFSQPNPPFVTATKFIKQLFGADPATNVGPGIFQTSQFIDLRPYRYLDIISPTLTYAQNVKDASTANIVRDVLCRWYFDYDNETTSYDDFGFPILMGYKPFYIRRIYNPPKQIKWDNNIPIPGVIEFAVYDNNGVLATPYIASNGFLIGQFNFLLTLQVSEN